MNEKINDIIIIGAGAAGITAAIYAARAGLNIELIDQAMPGGQILNTYEIDNYPGCFDLSGFDLAKRLLGHAKKLGIEPILDNVLEIETTEKIKTVITSKATYKAKTVILATGGTWKELGIPGEKEFKGRGVSYCATCDGAFFKRKITTVIGGGNVAVEDAIYLSRFCEKVYLVHRANSLNAQKILQDKLKTLENIEIIWDTQAQSIHGTALVDSIKLKNNTTNEILDLKTDGIFVAIGTTANSDLLREKVKCDKNKNIIAGEDCKTSIPGIFAAGDVRTKDVKQVITAAADGATSIHYIEQYLLKNF